MRRCPGNNGDAQNAENRSYCVHQNNKVTLLQSCLDSKGHGNHQETHGKGHIDERCGSEAQKSSPTVSEREATCQNFF